VLTPARGCDASVARGYTRPVSDPFATIAVEIPIASSIDARAVSAACSDEGIAIALVGIHIGEPNRAARTQTAIVKVCVSAPSWAELAGKAGALSRLVLERFGVHRAKLAADPR
jgi:hypothetical protein